MIQKMIEKLLDLKAIIGLLVTVLIFVFLFSLLDGLQHTSLGDNEYASKTLEEGKKSLSILSNGYFLASSIAGAIGFIVVIVLIYRRYFD